MIETTCPCCKAKVDVRDQVVARHVVKGTICNGSWVPVRSN